MKLPFLPSVRFVFWDTERQDLGPLEYVELVPHPGRPLLWLLFYFALNLSLTLHNKGIMQFHKFSFPWTLTAIHTLCSALGCISLQKAGFFIPSTLTADDRLVMLAFSTLYTLNIAVSNVSLNMVTVPFHQTIRSTVPLFTLFIQVFVLKGSFSRDVALCMIPTTVGVVLATVGDYNYSLLGFFLTLLGTVLAAVKGIVTNRIMVGKLNLHPLDLLLRMSPLAFIQCSFYAFLTGELDQVVTFLSAHSSTSLFFGLLGNGSIAFLLNLASFTANKLTSALTMSVAGNVKQVASIVLSVTIFNLQISELNALGIFLTIVGGSLYTFIDMRVRRNRSTQPIQVKDDALKYSASASGLERIATKPPSNRRTLRSFFKIPFGKRMNSTELPMVAPPSPRLTPRSPRPFPPV